jgi:hypothetical protein
MSTGGLTSDELEALAELNLALGICYEDAAEELDGDDHGIAIALAAWRRERARLFSAGAAIAERCEAREQARLEREYALGPLAMCAHPSSCSMLHRPMLLVSGYSFCSAPCEAADRAKHADKLAALRTHPLQIARLATV